MNCNHCGNQVTSTAKFCDSCGASVSSESMSAQATSNENVMAKGDQDNKVIFVLSYLGILFFLPLVACPNSKTGRFHANQGLVLLLAGVVGQIVLTILSMILWRLWLLMSLVSFAWGIALLALMIIGMVNAGKGENKPLPIIGNIRILK